MKQGSYYFFLQGGNTGRFEEELGRLAQAIPRVKCGHRHSIKEGTKGKDGV